MLTRTPRSQRALCARDPRPAHPAAPVRDCACARFLLTRTPLALPPSLVRKLRARALHAHVHAPAASAPIARAPCPAHLRVCAIARSRALHALACAPAASEPSARDPDRSHMPACLFMQVLKAIAVNLCLAWV